MSSGNWAVLVSFFGLVLGPLGAYIVASRKLSGKVSTTEAGRLWDASEEMRQELREQLAEAMRRIAELEGRLATVERENAELVRVNTDLRKDLVECLDEVKHIWGREDG